MTKVGRKVRRICSLIIGVKGLRQTRDRDDVISVTVLSHAHSLLYLFLLFLLFVFCLGKTILGVSTDTSKPDIQLRGKGIEP